MTIHRAITRQPRRKDKGPERDSIQSPGSDDISGSIPKLFDTSEPLEWLWSYHAQIESILGQGAVQVIERESVFFGNDVKDDGNCGQQVFDHHTDSVIGMSPPSVSLNRHYRSVSADGGLQTRSPITSGLIILAGWRLNHLRG